MYIKGNNLEKPTGKLYYYDITSSTDNRLITNISKSYEETIRDILDRLTGDHKPGDIISNYVKVSKEDLISEKVDIFDTPVDPENDEAVNYIKYIEDEVKDKWRYFTRIIPNYYYISTENEKFPEYMSSVDGSLLENYLRLQEINEKVEKIAREKSIDRGNLEKLLKINPRSYKFELDSLKKDLAEYYLYTPWHLKKDYFYGYTTILKSGEKYYIIPEVMKDTGVGRDIEDGYCMYIGEEKDIMGTKVDINTCKLISGFYISSQNRKMIERIGNPYSCGFSNNDQSIDEPEYISCLCRIKYEDIVNPGYYRLKVRRLELISLRDGHKRGY